MSVKKKIIILLAIFLVFGVIFTIIFINRTTPEEEMLEEGHNYAVNTTAMTEETLPTVTEEIPEEVYESVAPTVSILYNEDMLTTEQAVAGAGGSGGWDGLRLSVLFDELTAKPS